MHCPQTGFLLFFTQDYHATGKTMPLVDQQQSYTLLSLNENDGQTNMTFQRAIQSCDEQDFHITVSSPNPHAHQLMCHCEFSAELVFPASFHYKTLVLGSIVALTQIFLVSHTCKQ